MGTELCYVFIGEIEDRAARLSTELVESVIFALRTIQRPDRYLSKQG